MDYLEQRRKLRQMVQERLDYGRDYTDEEVEDTIDEVLMEQESLEFHKKVVEGYRCLAEMNPDRIVKVDAALPKEAIHDIIISYVEKWLARP